MTGRLARPRGLGLAAGFIVAAGLVLVAARHFPLDLVAATAQTRAFAAERPALAAAGFALAYVTLAALAIPIVAAMSVAAGALFGLPLGLPLAVASNAAGATIAMLAVRYALRDRVVARFPGLAERWTRAAEGRDAALLFAARMTPVAPFALVNAAAAFSRINARTFALVSAAGAAPLAFAYVSAGAALGAIARPADVLSLRLFAALALAGFIPLAARALTARLARRRFD